MNKKWRFKWITNRDTSFLNVTLFDVDIKIYLAFLVIILVGFWPVSSGLLSLKNDEIVYFLPYRYNIVESIRNANFPLWSPYIYMGFPVSGDMQSGAWNPLVWLLALTGRYTLTTLHAELLLYIFFASLGLFKLMRVLKFRKIVCFTIGISYGFTGFIIDSGQFMCWVSCACFLPYTYIYFIRILENPGTHSGVKFALANFCLLIAGGYPFFFIANVYFLAIAFLIFCFICWRNRQPDKIKKTFTYLSLSVILFSLISAAPLLSFINLLPYYARGTHLPLQAAIYNSYSIFSTVSLLFPFSITRDHLYFGNNNVLSRNLYIGIILLPFAVKGFFTKPAPGWNTVLFFLIVSLALSLGEQLPFRKWAYAWLPLMNTFRHPSNFRLFMTVGLLAFAAKGLHECLSFPTKKSGILRAFYLIALCMLLIAVCFLPLKENNPFQNASLSAAGLKKVLTSISFRQGVFLSFLLQIPFLLLAIFLFKKAKYYQLCMLSLINVIILGQPQLLSSTVAKNPVFEINEFIKSQPQGFPITELARRVSFPDEQKIFLYEYKEPLRYFYNKKIAINTFVNNPTILSNYREFIADSNLISLLKDYWFIYAADSIFQSTDAASSGTKNYWLQTRSRSYAKNGNDVSIISFTPNAFELTVKETAPRHLVILQNNFPGWKATAGGKSIPILTVNKTFMGLNLPAGNYRLNLEYDPDWFLPGLIISLTGVLLTLSFLIFKPGHYKHS